MNTNTLRTKNSMSKSSKNKESNDYEIKTSLRKIFKPSVLANSSLLLAIFLSKSLVAEEFRGSSEQ